MSEENEGEEKKDGLAKVDEFDFYFSFTKPLVLDLPSSEDRAIAAAWVQKLEAESETEEEKQLRLNYLKLLLFVLQRGRLSGIFRKQPPSGPLEPFPQGFSITDMGNWMLDQDDGQPSGAGDARSVPYMTEISNDLREFVASQEIPNFGIQMYYAWSSEDPIHKWISFDEEKCPQFILDKIKQLKEIRSEDKAFTNKNSCPTKKKGCDITLQERKKKVFSVKSPQEIERSQGRSFQTYMGLVGRMGNFNDNPDDPEKFQKLEQRKAKCQRNVQKRCPTNEGEGDDLIPEDYDDLVNGLGGLNSQNKKFLLSSPSQQESCSDPYSKGGPQAFELPKSPCRNLTYPAEVLQCSTPDTLRAQNSPAEQCADMGALQTSQQMNRPGRSRSYSPSPPSSIQCPREAVRQSPDMTRNTEPTNQEICSPEEYGNRASSAPGKSPDQCSPTSTNSGSNRTPTIILRPGQTEIIHCYDSRNPDPALYEKMDREWVDAGRSQGVDITYEDQDYASFVRRNQQMTPRGPEFSVVYSPKCQFKPLAHSTPVAQEPCGVPTDVSRHAGRFCPPQFRVTSPPYRANLREQVNASFAMESSDVGNCGRPMQQMECDIQGAAAPPPSPSEAYPKADTCRKPQTQAVNKAKICSAFGGNEGGRLADMVNVLQGLKQRTEAHREKCDQAAVRRVPPNDAACYSGSVQPPAQTKPCQQMATENGAALPSCSAQSRNARGAGQPSYYTPQPKPTQLYSPYQDTEYVSLPDPNKMKCMRQQQQPFLQRQSSPEAPAVPVAQMAQAASTRQVGLPAGFNPECYPNTYGSPTPLQEVQYEGDEFDTRFYESLDRCKPESPQGVARELPPDQVMPQSSPQRNIPAQNFLKAMMPEADFECSHSPSKWASMNSAQSRLNRSSPHRDIDNFECRSVTQQSDRTGLSRSHAHGGASTRSSPARNSPPCARGQAKIMETESPACRPGTTQKGSARGSPGRNNTPSERGQTELVDIFGQPVRADQSSTSPASNYTSSSYPACSPATSSCTRSSPPRSSPARSTPSRGGPDSTLDVTPANTYCSTPSWASKSTMSGYTSPDPATSPKWASPIPAGYLRAPGFMSPDPEVMEYAPLPSRSYQPQTAACPAPRRNQSPSMGCPRQRSSPNYCPRQMNAKLQFQEQQMTEQIANMEMNDADVCEEQGYMAQDETCENDAEGYDEEGSQDCDPQNFSAMRKKEQSRARPTYEKSKSELYEPPYCPE